MAALLPTALSKNYRHKAISLKRSSMINSFVTFISMQTRFKKVTASNTTPKVNCWQKLTNKTRI